MVAYSRVIRQVGPGFIAQKGNKGPGGTKLVCLLWIPLNPHPPVRRVVPIYSAADPSFWHALAHQKLHEHKLSDDVVRVTGFYTYVSTSANNPCFSSVLL